MGKIYNEKHDVLINTYLQPNEPNPKNNTTVPHQIQVSSIEMFMPNYHGQYINVKLNRNLILDIAAEIERLEKQEVMHVFIDMPF